MKDAQQIMMEEISCRKHVIYYSNIEDVYDESIQWNLDLQSSNTNLGFYMSAGNVNPFSVGRRWACELAWYNVCALLIEFTLMIWC